MIVMLALGLMTAQPTRVFADDIAFEGWTHQRFGVFGGNNWRQSGRTLSVESDGHVSLLWRPVPEKLWQATKASWSWNVETSVPPTDLSQKGGDDRNLALYFIFAPRDLATRARELGIRKLLGNTEIRVLMYVWGGSHDRNTILASPYLGARGKTIVLRPAGTGQRDETIDLRSDLDRAYGSRDLMLIGLATSADSDDTETRIEAGISDLRLSGYP
jgi:hypothetical protein